MKNVLLGVVAALTMSAGANAAVTVTEGTLSSPVVIDFETPAPWSGYVANSPDVANTYTRPIGSTGNYGVTGPATVTTGTLDLSSYGALNAVSFLWGTIDAYNFLDVYSGATLLGTISGSDLIAGADGTQTKNAIVSWDGPLTTDIKLVFHDTIPSQPFNNAFEFDNVKLGAVPEPAAWMTMLAGFGIIGAAMRRRRPTVALA
jgi:hypothetical protein